MSNEVSQSEETQLIKDDNEEINDERCSSCMHFPKAVYFIIITELCERFNYYGMRTILILYLTQHILLSEGNAVSIYHLFVSLCYFTTIIGSFISDNYLGKYKTILILASIYATGSMLMSLTSIPYRNLAGPMISLILIGFGTGGVKSCVGPFGGDQIPSTKRVVIDSFFSMFYFAINLGALFSTILTPILRADVACNGSDDCYPLAFGIPAILMFMALIIFVVGRQYYIDVPVRQSIYIRAVGCIFVSIRNWFRHHKDQSGDKPKQLLDYASDEYSVEFIQDLRTLSRIAMLYLPLPVYWALYEQMGSRWTLQAAQLDGELGSKFIVLPDQLSLLNVVFVMILIPIFDSCIYPICYRIKPKLRPLRRMTVGISITCLSFLAAYCLQTQIEARQPPTMIGQQSRLYLVNGAPCDVSLISQTNILTASSYTTSDRAIDFTGPLHKVTVKLSGCQKDVSQELTTNLAVQRVNFLIVGLDNQKNMQLNFIADQHSPNRKGHPLIKLISTEPGFSNHNLQLQLAYTGDSAAQFVIGNFTTSNIYASSWQKLIKPGRFLWSIKAPNLGKQNNFTGTKWTSVLASDGNQLLVKPTKIVSSAVTMFYLTYSSPDKVPLLISMPINNGSTISITWQIPQYILISIGEVLVSITGLSFSYDQAPEGMKSLVNAFWYLSNAFGNVIVMIVAKMQLFEKLSWEYLIFAGLCLVFNVIFAALAYIYRMRTDHHGKQYESMMEITAHDNVE